MSNIIGAYALPVIVFGMSLTLLMSKNNLFDEFIIGCRKGFATSIKILPTFIILLCAVKMFSASGALGVLCDFFGSFTENIGIPKELIPIIFTRPISASATNAMVSNLYSTIGPDSFAGRAASILAGSTDTIIYTLSIYFSSCGVTKTKYALGASFILFVFCIFASLTITGIYFK